MKPFSYANAQSLESAASLAGRRGAVMSGGIDLLGEMKEGIASPERVVNLMTIPGLARVERTDAAWRIGANVTLAALAASEELAAAAPGIVDASREVASPQIRNAVTLGGNLAQHSRCWYYRHRDIKCLKNGGATCYAREGENKYHSLFTGNPCISPVVSNLSVIFDALGARAIVHRRGKSRPMSMEELYEDAWDNPLAHNSLRQGDIIEAVEFDAPAGLDCAYLQACEKRDFDWALVSCAAAATVEDGVLRSPRVTLGAVAPVPYSSQEVNAFLDGKPLEESVAAQAAEMLLDGARPLADNGYKIPIAKALAKRALMKLSGKTQPA